MKSFIFVLCYETIWKAIRPSVKVLRKIMMIGLCLQHDAWQLVSGIRYRDRSSGEKKFVCEYPDCGLRYFNRHTMLRHQTKRHGREKRDTGSYHSVCENAKESIEERKSDEAIINRMENVAEKSSNSSIYGREPMNIRSATNAFEINDDFKNSTDSCILDEVCVGEFDQTEELGKKMSDQHYDII